MIRNNALQSSALLSNKKSNKHKNSRNIWSQKNAGLFETFPRQVKVEMGEYKIFLYGT